MYDEPEVDVTEESEMNDEVKPTRWQKLDIRIKMMLVNLIPSIGYIIYMNVTYQYFWVLRVIPQIIICLWIMVLLWGLTLITSVFISRLTGQIHLKVREFVALSFMGAIVLLLLFVSHYMLVWLVS